MRPWLLQPFPRPSAPEGKQNWIEIACHSQWVPEDDLFFDISLAQWSLNQNSVERRGNMENLDFPAYAKEKFDIQAVEYVDQFFPISR